MKVVILAGGFGTRIGEETGSKPKPMISIGERPILWHIMKIYSSFGFNEFVICLGYKGFSIKEYFANYLLHDCDVTIDLSRGSSLEVHRPASDPWRITLVETGLHTMTGSRLRKAQPYIGNAPFMLTYGDGLARIDVNRLVAYHKERAKIATVTAVQPPGRFGALALDATGSVTSFQEKPIGDGGWINAGFFVLQPEIFSYLDAAHDDEVLEAGPLERLARDGELVAFKHDGFWQPLDTPRDKRLLETLWTEGTPPWKTW